MPRTFQQTINLVSVIAASIILALLLFFSSYFSWPKIFIMVCLMAAFILMLSKNRSSASKKQNLYGRPREKVNRQPTFGDRLTGFFENLNPNSYNRSAINSWRIDRTYSQEIDYNQKIDAKDMRTMGRSALNEQEEQQLRRRQFNIQLPQNVNQIANEIRNTVEPNNYFSLFNNELEKVKENKEKGNQSSSKIIFEDQAPNETYCFDNTSGKFKLVDNSNSLISDPVYAVDILTDFFKDKIDAVIRSSHYSFKSVSEIIMKCFGLRVNFGLRQRSSSSDSKEVTMEEVKQFLRTFRRQTTIYQNFKLIIPNNEFIVSYLERLIRTSQTVLRLLQHMDDPCIMTLKIYIDVLNQTFPKEDIRMTNDKSAYSPEMKNAKHVFYVHQSIKRVFFTYNNMKNFKTKNPLLAVLAFFTEILKTGKYQSHEVVRNLKQRIITKDEKKESELSK